MKLYKSRTSQKVFSVEISETGFVTLRTPDGRIYNNTGSIKDFYLNVLIIKVL